MISVIIPVYSKEKTPRPTVIRIQELFRNRFSHLRYEFILAVNPALSSDPDFERISASFINEPEVKLLAVSFPGKGNAIQKAFAESQGKWILLTDSDLPYGIEFIAQAISLAQVGVDFVTPNRRHPESFVDTAVSTLRFANARHRLGMRFNQLARFLLGIQTRDTQAGCKLLSREFATQSLRSQFEKGFFFDLELFTVARRQNFTHQELPVTLTVDNAATSIHYSSEFFRALWALIRVRYRALLGAYDG